MMDLVYGILHENLEWFILGLLICCFLILLMQFIYMIKQRKLRKRIDRFMGSAENNGHIESMLVEYLGKVDDVSRQHNGLLKKVDTLQHRLQFCVQKVGMVRYNPFEDMGGDLCFALALLDQQDNGVVINTIYSREGSYTYAKKLTGGNSEKHKLSVEERQCVDMAMENKIV